MGAHPFSTADDQCLVHNGSLSNHNQMRRQLAKKGVFTRSENDTVVGAAYISSRIADGASLGEALEGKRINAPRTMSGATWAPNTVTWTGNNRTHMVRVPGAGRFELRLPDGAVNPYLLQAVIIAAGLSGMDSKADPGPRYDIDMYAQGHTVTDAPKLPLNMLDAIRAYDEDAELKAKLGEDFTRSYIKMKMQEWNSFVSHFSLWEKENTLDI